MSSRICTGCQNETQSSLKCPFCVKLKLESAFFCSQDCFRSNWNSHHEVHKAVQAALQPKITAGYESMEVFKEDDLKTWISDFRLRPFVERRYQFTGPLRPWPTPLPRSVPENIPRPDYARTGESKAEERSRGQPIKQYQGNYIDRLRRCCRIGREALDLANTMCKPGVTGEEIDLAVHNHIVEKGGYPSPLNYYGFPKSCCISVNEVICHAIPDLRPLREGDIVNVDVSVFFEGVHGDLNETFFVGKCDEQAVKLVKSAHDALMAAIAICKPGEQYRRIGAVIQDHIDKEGFSVVRRYTGHGIGDLFHTAPTVAHWRNNKMKGFMKEGHVFTIEPMINEGKYDDDLWPDQWTAVTRDGQRSAQFEHQILITRTGCEVLTARTPESPSLGFDESVAPINV